MCSESSMSMPSFCRHDVRWTGPEAALIYIVTLQELTLIFESRD